MNNYLLKIYNVYFIQFNIKNKNNKNCFLIIIDNYYKFCILRT